VLSSSSYSVDVGDTCHRPPSLPPFLPTYTYLLTYLLANLLTYTNTISRIIYDQHLSRGQPTTATSVGGRRRQIPNVVNYSRHLRCDGRSDGSRIRPCGDEDHQLPSFVRPSILSSVPTPPSRPLRLTLPRRPARIAMPLRL